MPEQAQTPKQRCRDRRTRRPPEPEPGPGPGRLVARKTFTMTTTVRPWSVKVTPSAPTARAAAAHNHATACPLLTRRQLRQLGFKSKRFVRYSAPPLSLCVCASQLIACRCVRECVRACVCVGCEHPGTTKANNETKRNETKRNETKPPHPRPPRTTAFPMSSSSPDNHNEPRVHLQVSPPSATWVSLSRSSDRGQGNGNDGCHGGIVRGARGWHNAGSQASERETPAAAATKKNKHTPNARTRHQRLAADNTSNRNNDNNSCHSESAVAARHSDAAHVPGVRQIKVSVSELGQPTGARGFDWVG